MILNDRFAEYLNQLYCAKSHIIERLSDLLEHPEFNDIEGLLQSLFINSEKCASILESVYLQMGLDYSFTQCKELINLANALFDAILKAKAKIFERNLALLYYINFIKSIEGAALKNLELVIAKSADDEIIHLLTIQLSANQDDDLLVKLYNKISLYPKAAN